MKKVIVLSLLCVILLSSCSSPAYTQSNSDKANALVENYEGESYYEQKAYEADHDSGYVGGSPNYYEGNAYEYGTEAASYASDMTVTEDSYVSNNPDAGNAIFQTDPNRKLIMSGVIEISSGSYVAATANLESMVNSYAGYISNSNVQGTNDKYYDSIKKDYILIPRTASYEIKIPSISFTQFLTQTNTIGEIKRRNIDTRDISDSYYDTDSKVSILELRKTRLMELLEQTTKMSDILLIEKDLSDVIAQIESYMGTLRRYDNLVEYSTINVTIYEMFPEDGEKSELPAEPTVRDRISEKFGESVETTLDALTGLIVFIIGNIIYIALFAAIILVPAIIIKKRIKKVNTKQENTVDLPSK